MYSKIWSSSCTRSLLIAVALMTIIGKAEIISNQYSGLPQTKDELNVIVNNGLSRNLDSNSIAASIGSSNGNQDLSKNNGNDLFDQLQKKNNFDLRTADEMVQGLKSFLDSNNEVSKKKHNQINLDTNALNLNGLINTELNLKTLGRSYPVYQFQTQHKILKREAGDEPESSDEDDDDGSGDGDDILAGFNEDEKKALEETEDQDLLPVSPTQVPTKNPTAVPKMNKTSDTDSQKSKEDDHSKESQEYMDKHDSSVTKSPTEKSTESKEDDDSSESQEYEDKPDPSVTESSIEGSGFGMIDVEKNDDLQKRIPEDKKVSKEKDDRKSKNGWIIINEDDDKGPKTKPKPTPSTEQEKEDVKIPKDKDEEDDTIENEIVKEPGVDASTDKKHGSGLSGIAKAIIGFSVVIVLLAVVLLLTCFWFRQRRKDDVFPKKNHQNGNVENGIVKNRTSLYREPVPDVVIAEGKDKRYSTEVKGQQEIEKLHTSPEEGNHTGENGTCEAQL